MAAYPRGMAQPKEEVRGCEGVRMCVRGAMGVREDAQGCKGVAKCTAEVGRVLGGSRRLIQISGGCSRYEGPSDECREVDVQI